MRRLNIFGFCILLILGLSNLVIGDTHTVKKEGGDFATLASALSDAGTGAGDTISIEGTWDVVDTAHATVIDNNITITADSDSRHPGYANEGGAPTHYRLYVNDGDHCITVNNTGCTISDIDIKQNAAGASDECIRMAANGGTLTINRCLIHSAGSGADQDGVYAGQIDCTINVNECIIYRFQRAGINSQPQSEGKTHTWNIRSCSITNCAIEDAEVYGGGISVRRYLNSTVNFNVFNTWVLDSNSGNCNDFEEAGVDGTINWNIHDSFDSDGSIAVRDGAAFNCEGNKNLTDDNTKVGDGDWVIVEETAEGTEDFRLQSNAFNEAQDYHANATGAGMTISGTTDTVGTSRPQNTNYDVGAFEIVSAADKFVPKVMIIR